ncbi:MAG TPA: NAD(P)H-hydrate dehydratase [Acidimicrobiales bacterium]
MRPVVTIEQMRVADAKAMASVGEATLVERAGTAVAHAAVRLLGGGYGHRVVVVAGPGNNGADGRVAARLLRRRGARVTVVPPNHDEALPAGADLVIDAAYGTGFRGTYEAPELAPGVPVLAVDIPSGVAGDTGAVSGRPLGATVTVTFAALKPGLIQGEGAELAGRVEVVDIGVEVDEATAGLIEDDDVAALLAPRRRSAHKWESAVAVVAGSPGMEGASALCARAAAQAGAGMVRLAVPGSDDGAGGTRPGPWPLEAVRMPLGADGWADDVLAVLARCAALVVGPGLGRHEATAREVRRLIGRSPVPVIADADALAALGGAAAARKIVAESDRAVVFTPHDGEYRAMAGRAPGEDRLKAARDLAKQTGAVVLLKGPLTVVASPDGAAAAGGTRPAGGAQAGGTPPGGGAEAGGAQGDGAALSLLSLAGSARLATAGTGDVLSGIIGAFVARGTAPAPAAALAAHVHGRAAALGAAEGLVASDLPVLVSRWLSSGAAR